VDIEKVSETAPEKILTFQIDPASGIQPYHGRKLIFGLGLQDKAASTNGRACSKVFIAVLSSKMPVLIEINPLVVHQGRRFSGFRCEMTFDDNGFVSAFPILKNYEMRMRKMPQELEANRQGLSYVKLDGNIGCMVNGAGLAMADHGYH